MRENGSLPPLPAQYRDLAPVQDAYGFRRGAFLLSLAFLVAAIALWLAPGEGGESWLRVPAMICVVVFAMSAIFSRAWSDRPVMGFQRLLGESQFAALGVAGFGLLAFITYSLAHVAWLFIDGSSLVIAITMGMLALLMFLAWRVRAPDRIRQRDKELAGTIEAALFYRSDLMSGGHGPTQ
jgi:hypothetical protein